MDSSSMGTLDLSKQGANIVLEDAEEDVLAFSETIQPAPTIDDRDALFVQKFKEARKNLFEVFTQREIFWRQRSKQLWLQARDSNSKFFHKPTSSRRRNNLIAKLKDSNGIWHDWDTGLTELMMSYFQGLFSSSGSDWSHISDCISPCISAAPNEDLLKPVEADEISKALFQMHPDKALGPDGMTPGFYQKCWDVVDGDVAALVQNFFLTQVLPGGLNNTNVVLIPKKKQPSIMGELDYPLCGIGILYFVHAGREMDQVLPTRGIRKGDPISRYLFILCAQGFSGVLRKYEVDGKIHGCKVARRAPVETCKALEGIMAKLWWKTGSSTTRSITWMRWGRMCRHKHAGGLGFQSFHDFNLSLLGKQGWQLLTNESSLIGKVFKARYYPNGTFLDARLGNNPNFVWGVCMRLAHCSKQLEGSGGRWFYDLNFT
uniref:Uncharacterized protein n=1 Tax=Cannabis sativa TaxID=3483 RepID=A0A803QBR0_CANSA